MTAQDLGAIASDETLQRIATALEEMSSGGGGGSVTCAPVVQTTGTDEEAVMSQKASTDSFAQKDEINALKDDLDDFRDDVSGLEYYIPITLHYNLDPSGNNTNTTINNRGITFDYIKSNYDIDVIVPDGYSIARHRYYNGIHESIDSEWQTGTVRLEKGYKWKFVLNTGKNTYGSEVTQLNNLIKQKTHIASYVDENITPYINDLPKIVYSNFVDVTSLLGIPINRTYFTSEGYVVSQSRCAYVGLLKTEILKRASKIRISINDGYKYSRQVFSNTGELNTIGNFELYNDTEWQTGETIFDIGDYESPITFGLLRNDGDITAECGLKVEIFYENTVKSNFEKLNELQSDVTELKNDMLCTSMSEYFGEPIQIKAKFKHNLINNFAFNGTALPNAYTGEVQCFAFYNGYIVVCFKNGGIAIYNNDYTLYKDYKLSDVGINFHAANCFFYGTNPDSDFPYLYVSETTGQKRCAVISLDSDAASVVGWLSFNGTFGTGTDYYDWNYDDVSKHIFLVGYDNYSRSNYHIIVKDLGQISSDLTHEYADSDVLSTKHDYHMSVLQGGCFHNGRLFYTGSGLLGEGLYVYDVFSNNMFKSFVHVLDIESEGCCVYGTSIYYLFGDGKFYKLDFA